MVDRTFGPAGQAAIHELRRLGIVALSEAVEPTTAAAIVLTVDVVREQIQVAGTPSQGVQSTWAVVPGLSGLTAYVRTSGKWRRQGEDRATELRDGERIVTLFDVPATGAGDEAVPANVLTLDDRISYDDPIFGAGGRFKVTEVRPRTGAGLVTALTVFTRS